MVVAVSPDANGEMGLTVVDPNVEFLVVAQYWMSWANGVARYLPQLRHAARTRG